MTVALLIALVLLMYIYVGYPLVLWGLTSLAPRRAKRSYGDSNILPKVSVCFCVHSGATFLARKIESLLAQDYPPERMEILIYSDGSTDETESVAHALAAVPQAGGRIRVVAKA